MNKPLQPNRWSPITDYAILLGSGVGAVASLATQNAVIATVPMTALVAAGLLNRRRLDQYLKLTDKAVADLDAKLGSEMSVLTQQVSALPTPETITQLQRSATAYSDRNIAHCIDAIDRAEKKLHQRIDTLEAPDLSGLYQDNAELQDQFTQMCTTISNLSKEIERISHLPRVEATEADVARLKTEVMQLRVSLESMGSDAKTAQATLQDAIRHLDRRLRQVPSGTDPTMLKGEVRELVKAVSDLVPRRDFLSLTEKLQTLQESQEHLRETLDRLRSSPEFIAQNGHASLSKSDFEKFQTELKTLSNGLRQVEGRLQDISVPFDITAEIRGTTATYLSGLQWQLSQLEQQTHDLMQQQQTWASSNGHSVPQRSPQSSDSSAALPDNQAQWLMALRGQSREREWSAIDQALYQALDEVTERLVLVWPWSSTVKLDSLLIERFTELLATNRRLEIGWCHPGNRKEGRLLRAISQQWRLSVAQRRLLKQTLNLLLPLKHQYPDRFSFKILGTKEQFLICDRRYAIIGLEALPATSSIFPELDLRIRSQEAAVIDQLLHRFEHPDELPEDATAYFNRAVTRYDLRDADGAIADFAHVLRLQPQDAVALNNRGLIWVEKNQYQRAIEDFDHALSYDAFLFSARCNRGWLHMHQGQFEQAVADFDVAVQADGTSAIPHFYRGHVRQQIGDSLGAIADFTQAIHKNPQASLPYCYRGAAYQRQGDINRAITDLEMAASLMHAQGDHRALAQVTQVLSSLKQAELSQPIKLHSA